MPHAPDSPDRDRNPRGTASDAAALAAATRASIRRVRADLVKAERCGDDVEAARLRDDLETRASLLARLKRRPNRPSESR